MTNESPIQATNWTEKDYKAAQTEVEAAWEIIRAEWPMTFEKTAAELLDRYATSDLGQKQDIPPIEEKALRHFFKQMSCEGDFYDKTLLEVRPPSASQPQKFDPKYAREELTPTRRDMLNYSAHTVGEAAGSSDKHRYVTPRASPYVGTGHTPAGKGAESENERD